MTLSDRGTHPCVLTRVPADDVPLAHALAATAYAAFQWTVHVVVYPQMGLVDPTAAPAYVRAHQRRVVWLVAPLFTALVTTTGALLVAAPGPASAVCAACTAIVLAVTGLAAVPLHRTLSRAWDAGAHRRLERWDMQRVAAASVQAVVGVALAWSSAANG